jgi:hypothetical protein
MAGHQSHGCCSNALLTHALILVITETQLDHAALRWITPVPSHGLYASPCASKPVPRQTGQGLVGDRDGFFGSAMKVVGRVRPAHLDAFCENGCSHQIRPSGIRLRVSLASTTYRTSRGVVSCSRLLRRQCFTASMSACSGSSRRTTSTVAERQAHWLDRVPTNTSAC